VLYAFTGGADGSLTTPRAGVIRDSAGNLYGTTSGFACPKCTDAPGAVFKVDATGNETTLYTFTCGSDGCTPLGALVRDSAGNLYGTTYSGTVFKVDTAGNETTLHTFNGMDGKWPQSRLLLDSKGNLYGTAAYGGDSDCNPPQGCGTVFKLDAAGNFTLLHTFGGGQDGEVPMSGLVQDAKGNLYGTTAYGGGSGCNGGCGTVFKIDGNGKETVFYSFAGGGEGFGPLGDLVQDRHGNLYGTTPNGGAGSGCYDGCGTIFRVNKHGEGTVLYSFLGGADGEAPIAGLFRDAAGNFYGTTIHGGNGKCYLGCGTVFRLDRHGKETVLYPFSGRKDGRAPEAVLVQDAKGNLYGTAGNGGDLKCDPNYGTGCGVVFEIAP
jgi:uncharacterized repeat protein (TIGR03803 family)